MSDNGEAVRLTFFQNVSLEIERRRENLGFEFSLFSCVHSHEFALCKSPSEERLRFDEPVGLSKLHKRYSFDKRVTEKL